MNQTQSYRILVINPMVEATMIAIYEDDHCLYEKSLLHPEGVLQEELIDQIEERRNDIIKTIHSIGLDITKFDAVCGRGGLLRPIEGGTYLVTSKMVDDLVNNRYGEHISNLGAILANNIAEEWNVHAYIVDPVAVDEMTAIAKKTGVPEITRRSIFHALNQKSAGRMLAKELMVNYEDLCLIVAHIGGGVSVGAHQYGQVIDVNNGFDGDGPFSFERAGAIPNNNLIDLCFESGLTKTEIKQKLINHSGLKAHLNIERQIDLEDIMQSSPNQLEQSFDMLAYQVAKEIGKMSTVLAGNVTAIVLTGHLTKWEYLTEQITNQVSWIADVHTIPGENILLALAKGTLRILKGEELVKQY